MWAYRTMIVPAAIVEQVRQLASNFPSTEGMWTTPIREIGSTTPTHYASAGLIRTEFLPLFESAEALATETGMDITLAEAILGQCIVDPRPPFEVLQDHGLELMNDFEEE